MYRADLDHSEQETPRTSVVSTYAPPAAGQRFAIVKRTVDIFGAAALIVTLAPLFVALIAGVKFTSAGRVFFVQRRVGRGGEEFDFYKFRSMHTDGDRRFEEWLDAVEGRRREWDLYQKIDDDPRITSFGRWIRRTSLDELPQLWNVLKGDMSLVGPRPCTADQRSLYGERWGDYCSVRPGLTGLWQVSGRNLLTFEQRVRLDSEYVQTWTFASDIKILIRTVKVVLQMEGSR